MPKRVHMFSDEGGDLTFKPPGNGLSRYFMIGTVVMKNCAGALSLSRVIRALTPSASVMMLRTSSDGI